MSYESLRSRSGEGGVSMNAAQFFKKFGKKPEDNDLARVNCKAGGEPGHYFCGLCRKCRKPKFLCEHFRTRQEGARRGE